MNQGGNLEPGFTPEQPILQLRGIRRVFIQGEEELEVLKGIDLDIHAGEFVAIVGQSGSGKSTLMNILGCLDQPTSGTYHVLGQDVASMGADELSALRRETFGFVFQRYNLLPGSDALENVEMPAVYAKTGVGERKDRARELLTRLGLEARLDYKPSQLSGGQQQRVSIARALMNGGKIILADEPTGALDKKSSEEVLALLKELHQEGHTIILITHDNTIAARAARTITLGEGVIDHDTGAIRLRDETPVDAEFAIISGSGARKGKKQRKNQSADSGLPLSSSLKMALRALKDNKFRTMLTLLGIIIGVASVVAMLALGNGATSDIMDTIGSMGTDMIAVTPGSSSSRSNNSFSMDEADLRALAEVPGVAAIVGENSGVATVRYQERDYTVSYTATGVDKPLVADWRTASGEFFNQDDVESYAPVVVLGQGVVDKLFQPGENPLGKYVSIQNVPFQVIGVMEIKDSNGFGGDPNVTMFVPYTTSRLRLNGTQHFGNISVKVEAGRDMNQVQYAMEDALYDMHPEGGFDIMNASTVMEAVNEAGGMMTLLLGCVGGISLLVGGIGVMNIMLVSVAERTREIGIRMACGARQHDILSQFLTEALLVCLIGGILGLGLGVLLGVLAQFIGITAMFTAGPMLIAFGCSLAIGLIFGFTPARKAARLDPVVALASE